MKNYIFLNTTIANIGGAEIYISNKCKHLEELGYNVMVISFEPGKIKLDNLKRFEPLIIPELKLLYRRSNEKVRKKILNVIKSQNLVGQTIIESNIDNLNIWGEYLAKEIGAYHICYLLPEKNHLEKNDYYFYKFKFQQKSLFGIKANTIADMMNDGLNYLETQLSAVGCTNIPISAIEMTELNQIKSADYTILSLGRLNKPYIISMLEGLSAFAKNNQNTKINILIVGGYSTSDVDRKVSEIKNQNRNLDIYECGELYPIPRQIFDISDVAIAVAGCASICNKQGLPTITIDRNDHKGIGIYKRTTDNTTFRTEEPLLNLEDLLYDILIKKTFIKQTPQDSASINLDYSKHDLLLSIPSKFEYYNVSHRAVSFLDWFIKITIIIVGFNAYNKFVSIIKR